MEERQSTSRFHYIRNSCGVVLPSPLLFASVIFGLLFLSYQLVDIKVHIMDTICLSCTTFLIFVVCVLYNLYNDENTHEREFGLHLISKVALVLLKQGWRVDWSLF